MYFTKCLYDIKMSVSAVSQASNWCVLCVCACMYVYNMTGVTQDDLKPKTLVTNPPETSLCYKTVNCYRKHYSYQNIKKSAS